MKWFVLFKAKAFIMLVAGVLLIGGATAAFAATPAGQTVVQSLTHGKSSVTPAATHSPKGTPANTHGAACPGLTEAQHLATTYHLGAQETGNAVLAICALHDGTFQSITTTGANVTIKRVYGYGEIDQLLFYAQYLATQDGTNTDGALSDLNVGGYLANALQSCGSTPVEACVKMKVPGSQPGNGHGNKPAVTPTPHGQKPVGTPTPHGQKPAGTPTPHGQKPDATPTPQS